jgi:glycine/D-amino acid oxidase-like deaminating enzyme
LERDSPARFVIVGGGTAGWLAAFLLRDAAERRGFAAKITVIESSKIPTIGVGEGTTAVFRILLKLLGVDEMEFLRAESSAFALSLK